MNIKEKVQILCKQRKITVKELEIASGLSAGTIGKWDVSIPSIDKVQKVANYFSVPLSYFGEKEIAASMTATADEVVNLLPCLTQEEVDTLLIVAKSLIARRQSPGEK